MPRPLAYTGRRNTKLYHYFGQPLYLVAPLPSPYYHFLGSHYLLSYHFPYHVEFIYQYHIHMLKKYDAISSYLQVYKGILS